MITINYRLAKVHDPYLMADLSKNNYFVIWTSGTHFQSAYLQAPDS